MYVFTNVNTGDAIPVANNMFQAAYRGDGFNQIELVDGTILDVSDTWESMLQQFSGGGGGGGGGTIISAGP